MVLCMEFQLRELLEKGFEQVRLTDGTYYAYQHEGVFLLAKRIEKEMYYLHGSRDAFGKHYADSDLSSFEFENLMLEDFISVMGSPGQFAQVK